MSCVSKPRIDADAVLARIQAEGPDALLTRGEAAALVAARTMDAHDAWESSRNRVGMQLDRAAELGKRGVDILTGGISRLPDGEMTADELRRWACRKYGSIFEDLPRGAPRQCFARLEDEFGLGAQVPDIFVLPADPARKDELIGCLRAELNQLKADAAAAKAERNRKLAARLNRKR